MIYCTCGHFLVEGDSSQKSNKLRLDALSIPHCVIKKERLHGARHGKTEEQKEYYVAFNAWKRCRKRVDGQEEHYEGIHDRFIRDQVYRESQLTIGWTEQKCIEMDKLAQEDHTYRLSKEEFKRFQGQWYLTLSKSGKNAPMRLPSGFRAAVTIKNRLHRESGEERAEPIFFNNIRDGTLLPQVIPGGTGTRPKAGGVSCKSTSASLFIIHEWCPRPSLAVMPTGLQVRFLPWHHCQPCLVCNFGSFRCSKGVLTLMASLNFRYDLEDRQS